MSRIFGKFTAVLLIGFFILIAGACGRSDSRSDTGFIPPYVGAELRSYPVNSIPAGFTRGAVVTIKDAMSAATITNAIVVMNGTPLSFSVPDQQYIGDVVVSPGATVVLSAIVEGGTYTGTGKQFTSYPVISSPASDFVWSPSDTITVVWSGGTPTVSSIGYGIGITNAADPNGPFVWPGNGYYLDQILKTGSSDDIPWSSLTAGSYSIHACIVGNKTTILNATPDSAILFLGCGYVPITVQ